MPDKPREVYDVRDVIAHLVDGGELLELGPALGAQHGRRASRGIDGRPIGVIANQPRHLGGMLDADARARRAPGS